MRRIAGQTFVFVVFVALWESAAKSGYFSTELFPGPRQVGSALVELLRSGTLFHHIISSLLRVAAGFCLAAAIAIPLGIAFGWYAQFGRAMNPLIQFFRTVSPIA